ncbi:calmodulin, putative [Pediculus humanus corporis]|uniref:Calmodulin, putative n=1 Tax=Pediculus humanus subsp. corporis TaxID=121224 RepID=E0VSY2_PEDHC|nr:calmodulin, putative [Pediculus humanus corporis]EEB16487.1 calmodulin, putative [Pediculus humanus corporis]
MAESRDWKDYTRKTEVIHETKKTTEDSLCESIECDLTDFRLNDLESEICRSFALLDVRGEGVVSLEELKKLLVSLGRLPHDDELANIVRYALTEGCEESYGMNFKCFKSFVMKQLCVRTEEEDEQLRRAFDIFDVTSPPTGKLNVKVLRHHLKKLGDKLTDDEIDFLYREEDYWMLDEIDTIEYEKIICKLLDKPCDSQFLGC